MYVVPISEGLSLRLLTFGKLLLDGVPFALAKQLFQKDKPNEQKAQVMALSRQALLFTAELIKCIEVGASDISAEEKLMDVLIDNGYTTSDSIAFEMLQRSNGCPLPSPWPTCTCASRSSLSGYSKRALPSYR